MQYNPEELDEILNIYKAESEEIIQELNDGFLELEKNPENKEPLKKLFQLVHSLKGASRMLGFNSVQDISHKLEDILSYWKKEGTIIEKNSFQVIYEVCDLINELIIKSVQQKSDYIDNNVMVFLNKLDNFILSEKPIDNSEKIVKKENYLVEKSKDIDAIILELIFILGKNNEKDNIDEILSVIVDNINLLYEIFNKTEYDNVKNHIKEILNEINNNNDKENAILKFKEQIKSLKDEIYIIFKDLNINLSSAKLRKKEETKVEKEEKQRCNEDIEKKFDLLLKNLPKIKYEKNYINKVNEELKSLIVLSNNKQTEIIISKTLNILKLFQDKDILIDNECYMVILQSIYLAKRMSLNEKEENLNNLNFLIQRLNVVEDMFKITNLRKQKTNNDELKIQPQSKSSIIDIDTIKNNINSFELQEIKTLRVDTSKLDNLISQTGELLVNGIKTREHLFELSNINMKLIQWNSASKKIINYLKYLEKKGFFNTEFDDSAFVFYKKAQNFFWNNADMITDIQKDFNRLYNIISEDDNKLHQTAMEIETIAKGIRVLPLATIFHSFPRMIRDIAIENKKKVDFIVSGSDTTVDKKLIEEIKMPLIHILRNAVSHGIEVPEERIKNGKKDIGIVKLSAKQAENNVIITIEDDGYGINLEKVKKTAISKGILTEEEIENITNEQLMKLLFLPGFSTEDSVNEISGRGIGLDIVKTKINNLNGDIYIDSILNKGCRVTIKLPVSMSTIKTFIILVNDQKYAIPVNAIKYVKRINKNDIFDKNGQNYIIYDEHSIPIYSLSEVLGEKSETILQEKQLTVIIIENQERQAAFVIDKLLGDQEVFHKKLELPIIKIKNISGFTTLSTGEICLIVNPYELIRNTILTNYLSSFDIKQIGKDNEVNLYEKRLVIYGDNSFEFIKKDIEEEYKNVITFNNIYSVHDYIQKNEIDIFICKFNNEEKDKELIKLIKYIKNDENLSKIKIVIFSDLTIIEILNVLEGIKPDLYIKINDYNKKIFIEKIHDKLKV